jgi:hypothetical protein
MSWIHKERRYSSSRSSCWQYVLLSVMLHVPVALFRRRSARQPWVGLLFPIQSDALPSGFGGLVVSMLASGSNPAEVVGFSGRKNPHHAFLRRGIKAVSLFRRFAAYKRTLWFTWESESQAKLTSHFSPVIPSFTNRGLSCRLTWIASGDDGRS